MEVTVNKTIRNTALLLATALILITLVRLNYPLLHASTYAAYQSPEDITVTEDQEKCDIFTGEWVPDPDAPYYSNSSCWAIHEHQNCMKYGRPDSDFMKWRWKPDACHLPLFDPFRFLDMLRNKSVAFVGDSVGRNQMQSIICLLSRVEYPIDDSPTTEENYKRWKYVNYNFTLVYDPIPGKIRGARLRWPDPHRPLRPPPRRAGRVLDDSDRRSRLHRPQRRPLVHPPRRLLREPPHRRLPLLQPPQRRRTPDRLRLPPRLPNGARIRQRKGEIRRRDVPPHVRAVALRERAVERGRRLRAAAAVPRQRDDSGGVESGFLHDSVGGVEEGGAGGEEEVPVDGYDAGDAVEARRASE